MVKKGPLDGVKVIELSTWAAVPVAAGILGDWGADVIKVENPEGGDPCRGYRQAENIKVTDFHFWFELANRNKRSIAVNIRKEQGREILYRLVKNADVFLTNIGEESLKRWKLDYEGLSKLNPRLVCVYFTGFGEVGPDKDKPGYDITAFWTRGGFMYRLGEPGRIPPTQPQAPGDQISAMFNAGAVSTALYAREKTGKGQKVTLSLYHNAVWTLAWEIQPVLSTGMEVAWRYQDKAFNPLWNMYQAKDGRWLQLACLQSDPHWPGFCKAIEREDLERDPRFNSHQKREENKEVLVSLINEVVSKKTSEEWGRIFRRYDIIYEKAQSLKEIANDPQAIENDFFAEVKHPSGKYVKLVNSPVKFSETPSSIRTTAPELGQYTEEVLLDIGYTWPDISKFKEQRVIL